LGGGRDAGAVEVRLGLPLRPRETERKELVDVRSYKLRKNGSGKRHPNTIESMSDLAAIYCEQRGTTRPKRSTWMQRSSAKTHLYTLFSEKYIVKHNID
jgi:hypothetical protein